MPTFTDYTIDFDVTGIVRLAVAFVGNWWVALPVVLIIGSWVVSVIAEHVRFLMGDTDIVEYGGFTFSGSEIDQIRRGVVVSELRREISKTGGVVRHDND